MNNENLSDFYKVPDIKFDISKLRSDLRKSVKEEKI